MLRAALGRAWSLFCCWHLSLTISPSSEFGEVPPSPFFFPCCLLRFLHFHSVSSAFFLLPSFCISHNFGYCNSFNGGEKVVFCCIAGIRQDDVHAGSEQVCLQEERPWVALVAQHVEPLRGKSTSIRSAKLELHYSVSHPASC